MVQRYSPDKVLRSKVTGSRSKVTQRSNHNVAQLDPLRYIPTKSAANGSGDIAQTRFSGQRSQGKVKGHTEVRP